MLRPQDALICGLLLWGSAIAAPPSAPGGAASLTRETGLRTSNIGGATTPARQLTGKFLHITDFHPDPFYKTYSSTTSDAACHREHGPAGTYGAETSGCDSPYALINQTFKWINDNIRDDIDFVIWTGDSARHDNDEDIPRTQKQVIQQNEFIVSKFAEVFGHPEHHDRPTNDLVIPVVPTFGNNDIMPHNIFLSGPNSWTIKYLDIWRRFIPEAQRHQFQQGGWFSVEVIPGQLSVISLNTIYFFSSNSGVDGCASKREPGYEHMEWLRIQLQFLRDRGMKAIIMGHVPPARVDNKESWDETCWQKYTLWVRQFRDVIVGSLYGHMNIDHFMLQDFDQIKKDTEKGRMASGPSASAVDVGTSLLEDGEVTVASASDYLINLRQAWAQLPAPPAKSSKKSLSKSTEYFSMWDWLISKVSKSRKGDKPGKGNKRDYLDKIGGKYAERYATTLVAPSIVPNYFPTLRIIEYNITGLENLHLSANNTDSSIFNKQSEQGSIYNSQFSDDESYLKSVEAILKQKKKDRRKKSRKGPRKYKFKVPEGPSKSAPPGPAYSPQSLTWMRYVQYFANLTHINNDFVDPQRHPLDTPKLDMTSSNDQSPHTIFGLELKSNGELENRRWKEGKHGKHQGKRPRPEPRPNEFVFEVEYDTEKIRGFKDLTVRRWVEYARKIGQSGKKAVNAEDVKEFDDEEEDELDRDDQELDEETIDEDSDDDEEDDYQSDLIRGGKKKHRKHKKKKHISKDWLTFVKRAFVSTMNPHDIQELFGAAAPNQVEDEVTVVVVVEEEEEEEIMEL